MPKKFVFPMTSELWTPLKLTAADRNRTRRPFPRRDGPLEAGPHRGPGRSGNRDHRIAAGARIPRYQSRPPLLFDGRPRLPDRHLHPSVLADDVRLGAVRAADRLRECGQPAIRARPRPLARGSGARRAGGRALAPDRPVPHRKPHALARRRGPRLAGRQLGRTGHPRRNAGRDRESISPAGTTSVWIGAPCCLRCSPPWAAAFWPAWCPPGRARGPISTKL